MNIAYYVQTSACIDFKFWAYAADFVLKQINNNKNTNLCHINNQVKSGTEKPKILVCNFCAKRLMVLKEIVHIIMLIVNLQSCQRRPRRRWKHEIRSHRKNIHTRKVLDSLLSGEKGIKSFYQNLIVDTRRTKERQEEVEAERAHLQTSLVLWNVVLSFKTSGAIHW